MGEGFIVLGLAVALLAGPAAAQDAARQNDDCRTYDARGKLTWRQETDPVIDACTAIIQAGKEAGRRLVDAYVSRGNAYRIQHQPDRAIADFDAAIRLDPNIAEAESYREQAIAERDAAIRAKAGTK